MFLEDTNVFYAWKEISWRCMVFKQQQISVLRLGEKFNAETKFQPRRSDALRQFPNGVSICGGGSLKMESLRGYVTDEGFAKFCVSVGILRLTDWKVD